VIAVFWSLDENRRGMRGEYNEYFNFANQLRSDDLTTSYTQCGVEIDAMR